MDRERDGNEIDWNLVRGGGEGGMVEMDQLGSRVVWGLDSGACLGSSPRQGMNFNELLTFLCLSHLMTADRL